MSAVQVKQHYFFFGKMGSTEAAVLLFDRLSEHFALSDPYYYNYAVFPSTDGATQIVMRRDALSQQYLIVSVSQDACTTCNSIKQKYFDGEIPCVKTADSLAGVRCERRISKNSPAFLFRTMQPLAEMISSNPNAPVYLVQQKRQDDTSEKVQQAFVEQRFDLNAALTSNSTNVLNALSNTSVPDRATTFPIWQIALIAFFALIVFCAALIGGVQLAKYYKRKRAVQGQKNETTYATSGFE